MKKICVFCSSSDVVNNIHKKEAKKLAQILSDNDYTLVYGGAKVGVMGVLAKTVLQNKGQVIGVVPELIHNHNLSESSVTELIVTKDMKTRKAKMTEISDAFIALSGGFGTLEELLEVITLKQLGYHNKPIVIVNTDGFYDKLNEMFEMFFEKNFAKTEYRLLYYFTNSASDAISYIKNYKTEKIINKWYVTDKEN